MIWNSVPVMTIFDVVIIGLVLASLLVLHRNRQAARRLGLISSVNVIYFALLVIGLFYLSDLLIMHALPLIASHAHAMRIMEQLHLNWSWVAFFIAVSVIASGLTYLVRSVIPKVVSSITERERAEEELNKARDELEVRVKERTRALQVEITERKQAEEALRESEERFKDIAETASDWIWEMDENLRFTYFSKRMQEVCGLDPDYWIGKTRWQVGKDDPDEEKWTRHRADLQHHTPFRDFQYSYRVPDGRVLHVRVSGRPIFDGDGNFKGYRGTGTDITERERAEGKLRVRERQQAVVAELGQLALADTGLSEIFTSIVEVVAETLEADFCKILELLPDGQALLLRAGVGWKKGYVGQATVGTKRNSQAGYTLGSSGPVIVEDLAVETRFTGPALLTDHGVVSGMSVAIPDYGVLGVHTRNRRSFTRDDTNFIQAIANLLAEAVRRKRAEEALVERARRFEGLIRTSAKVATTVETDDTLSGIAEEAANLLGLEGAGYRLLEGDDDLVVAGRYGLAQEVMAKRSLKVGESLTGLVAKEERTIAVPDLRTDERLHPDHKRLSISQGIVAYLGTPLCYRERLIGVLNVYGKERHVFDDEEKALLRAFADHAAIAIEKARLYGQAKRHAEALGKEVAERRRAEEVLRRYEHIVSASGDLMAFIDKEYRYRAVNAAYLEAFGKSRKDMIGHEVAEIIGTEIFETHIKPRLNQCLSGKRANFQHWLELPGRGRCYLDVHYDPFRDADGSVSGVVVNVRDITEARELSEQLSYQASHDALTGLLNRRAFEQRLQQLLETAQAEKTEHVLCYLDLDQFKVINDTCGHIAGDELLRQLGQLLQQQVRGRDTLARLGGDEFGILLERCTVAQANRVTTAVKKAIERFQFHWEEKGFNIGVSIGVVPINEASESMAGVLRLADAACYAAKDAGRNRVHVYREDDVELAKRQGEMHWVAVINRALEENRFQLYFQPFIPLASRDDQSEGYELLIRLQDEDGRIVAPGAFLPAAERYNLATKVDRWVVGTAFEWLSRHRGNLERVLVCSINLSGNSLADDEFLEFVIRHFDERHIPPEKICFEVTETAAIANLTNATHFIEALKKRGCRFALDDFGSGLSSFAYLKNLPVDFLKIDGMFVKDIVDDPVHLAMVKSINDMGHVMGKQTIAEFVENDAIREKLQELGVDYAQGYGIAKPQPITVLETTPNRELLGETVPVAPAKRARGGSARR